MSINEDLVLALAGLAAQILHVLTAGDDEAAAEILTDIGVAIAAHTQLH